MKHDIRLTLASMIRGCVVCAGILLFLLMALTTAIVANYSVYGVVQYAFVIGMIWLVLTMVSRCYQMCENHDIILIMLFCFAMHLLLISVSPALGQDGMAAAWDSRASLRAILSGKICFMHEVRNQYWCNYELFLTILANAFRGGLATGQIVNAVCCTISIYPIFKMSVLVSSRGLARAIALFVGTSPVLMLYSTMLTSEFLAGMFMIYGAYFMMEAWFGGSRSRVYGCAALAGLSIGVAHLFKSVSGLLIASLFVGWLWLVLRANKRNLVVGLVGSLVVMVVVYGMARWSGQAAFAGLGENPELVHASRESSPYLYELALGLNVASDGIFDGKIAREFMKMSPAGRADYIKNALRRDWRQYPALMVRKFANMHGSHCRPGGCVFSVWLSYRGKDRYVMPKWMYKICDNWTMLFRFLTLVGGIGLLLARGGNECARAVMMSSIALVVGFAVVEQLIEGHGRYKTTFYPFYFLILPYAGVVLERATGMVRRVKDRVRIMINK